MAETRPNQTPFDTLNSRLQASALGATRKAAVLPTDIGFHSSLDHDLAQELDSVSERILTIANKLLTLATTVDQTKNKGEKKLTSRDDVVDRFESLVVDSMDSLLENADICLDNILGKNKAPAIAVNPKLAQKMAGKKPHAQKSSADTVIQHASYLPKPQMNFKKNVDNSDSTWYPSLSHKYNAKVPLGHVYDDPNSNNSNLLLPNHPYRYEISHIQYPPRMFTPSVPIPPSPLEETSAIWVSDGAQFREMLSKLREATELAVDLEHHSYRSYSGFLCLMQISDRQQDWVVDLLAVRDEIEEINEIFTNPAIVKVFHGAESDIVWLQQDFNIYIVNLFDTFHASKILDFPRHGLANLLEMYCDFTADKRYQLADWRIRPLTDDMLLYARSDTHFLLFIYDNLRNALLDKSSSRSGSPSLSNKKSASPRPTSLLDEALRRSAETSLRVYVKEPYDAAEGSGPGGWDTLAKRWNKISLTAGGPGAGVESMHREVYKSVHWWRERVAREEDESTRFVLPNHFLFPIAEQPPADIPSLLKIFKASIPPVVKRRARELLSVIKEAIKRGLPLVQPDPNEELQTADDNRPTADPGADTQAEVEVVQVVPENSTSSIWGRPSEQSTSKSALFGSMLSPSKPLTTAAQISTKRSALFGAKSAEPMIRVGSPNFLAVVTKIHKSLVMAPTLPQVTSVPSAAATTPSVPSPQPVVDPNTGMQLDIEIPYTSASQRTTKQKNLREEEQDTLVVVGQPRQKRKRKNPPRSKSLDSPSSETKEEPVEPFDFSAVPNILDTQHEEGGRQLDSGSNKRRKKQKRETKGTFYGDFPAPPKAPSEVKSGNRSLTFTK